MPGTTTSIEYRSPNIAARPTQGLARGHVRGHVQGHMQGHVEYKFAEAQPDWEQPSEQPGRGHGEGLSADWRAGCQLAREGAWGVPIPWAGKPDDAEHAAVRPGDYRGVHHGGHHGQEGIENLVEDIKALVTNILVQPRVKFAGGQPCENHDVALEGQWMACQRTLRRAL